MASSPADDAYEEYLWGESPRAFARRCRVGGPIGPAGPVRGRDGVAASATARPVRARRTSVEDLLRP